MYGRHACANFCIKLFPRNAFNKVVCLVFDFDKPNYIPWRMIMMGDKEEEDVKEEEEEDNNFKVILAACLLYTSRCV